MMQQAKTPEFSIPGAKGGPGATVRKVDVGIVGVTGYTGQELLRLLLGHPGARITFLAAGGKSDPGKVLRHFGRLGVPVTPFDEEGCARACGAVFLCLPHEASMEAVPGLLKKGVRVLDMSAAFRLKDPALYESAYKFTHAFPSLLAKAVYGLPEVHGARLRGARLIAVPGCYPTGAILAVAPLLAKGWARGRVIADSKSGVTGAGHDAKPDLMYCEVNDNFKAYGVFNHRHHPEMAQEMSALARRPVDLVFTPHLVPMNRGILSTVYLTLDKARTREAVLAAYKARYGRCPFVRVLEEGLPDTRGVRGTNFCDIGVAVRGRDVIVVSAIDNLVKGAAGEAVQSFNLSQGFPETTGLPGAAGAP